MRKVIVTGGSRGIGSATVELFASRGDRVAFIYKSKKENAEAVERRTGAAAIQADLANTADIRRAYEECCAALGGSADILVNNAGVSLYGLFNEMTEERWREVIDVNLKAVVFLTKLVTTDMIKKHGGNIVNIGSIWGRTGASCEVAYSTSKAAIRGFTTALAKELGPSNIRVNCVEPGVIDTEMNAIFDEVTLKALADETPLCRLGSPREVAAAAYFLTTDDASFITGQILGVDGGFEA